MFRERLQFRSGRPPAGRGAALGPLERRVLDCLWRQRGSASVRDLQPAFPSTAYTTLMTTLDRLYRKGLLERSKSGRAYVYRPRYSREALVSEAARHAIAGLLQSGRALLRPILSTLVDAVSESDARALDELERLVRERKNATRDRGRA
ncbi:MAG: BlaI/MecI/CopY family transcriptional regulator [Acidobacteriota bacterium]